MTDSLEKLAQQMELSAQQLQQRIDIGDRLDAARDIFHSGVFPTHAAASEAGKELTAAGFTTEVVEADGLVLLEAQKVSTVDAPTVNQFTKDVFSVMARHGGEYDGWGADVMAQPRTLRAWLPSWLLRPFRRH